VKEAESNPLLLELAKDQEAGSHPEADLLTAFQEGSLQAYEREPILAHLARCVECRKLLALTTEAVDSLPDMRRAVHPVLSWPRLRMPAMALAASLMLVVAIGVEVHERRKIAGETQISAFNQSVKGTADSSRLTNPAQVSSGAASARKAAPTGTMTNSTASLSSISGSEPSAGPQQENARLYWRIDGNGHAQHSSDGAHNWMDALPNEGLRMRVIAVFGMEVWIGGTQSHLWHSSNNGSEWSEVTLPKKSASHPAILHIRSTAEGQYTLEAENGILWSSTDNGRSWH
jgi:hypothetical protein